MIDSGTLHTAGGHSPPYPSALLNDSYFMTRTHKLRSTHTTGDSGTNNSDLQILKPK